LAENVSRLNRPGLWKLLTALLISSDSLAGPRRGKNVAESTQGSGAPANFPFDAFISYRRSDGKKAARRLRQKLQRYDIRKRLKHARRKKLNVFLDTVYERGAHDFYERNISPPCFPRAG
jgi:hypothetical protein